MMSGPATQTAARTADGIFTATVWVRHVGSYSLSCKLWGLRGRWMLWVEENGREMERTPVRTVDHAMHLADAWFRAYQSRFCAQLDARRLRPEADDGPVALAPEI
jgi:hypothetical protein